LLSGQQQKRDAIHAYGFLRDTGTLSASQIFNLVHRIPAATSS